MYLNNLKLEYSDYKYEEVFLKCCNYFNRGEKYLLDTNKYRNCVKITGHECEFNIFEKIIYDIAVETYKIQNKKTIDKNSSIVFWIKEDKNCCYGLHWDDINNSKQMTTIVYLSDSESDPTFFTDLKKQEGIEQKIENSENFLNEIKEFYLKLPRKNHIIAFNTKNTLHGPIHIQKKKDSDARKLLVLQIVDSKIEDMPCFNYLQMYQFISPNKELFDNFKINNNTFNLIKIEENDKVKEVSFSERTILFNENYLDANKLENKVNLEKDSFVVIKNNLTSEDSVNENTDSNSEENSINLNLDKFRQRFKISNFFNELPCKWIIHESENYAKNNGGWLKNRHSKYPTTDIELISLPSVFSFFVSSVIPDIKNQIEKHYCIKINEFDIRDAFIVKYDMENQRDLDMHFDGLQSNFTASILLNNDFKGCGIYYKDGCTVFPEIGDLMIHNESHEHSVLELLEGTRYIIVLFIKIN